MKKYVQIPFFSAVGFNRFSRIYSGQNVKVSKVSKELWMLSDSKFAEISFLRRDKRFMRLFCYKTILHLRRKHGYIYCLRKRNFRASSPGIS